MDPYSLLRKIKMIFHFFLSGNNHKFLFVSYAANRESFFDLNIWEMLIVWL